MKPIIAHKKFAAWPKTEPVAEVYKPDGRIGDDLYKAYRNRKIPSASSVLENFWINDFEGVVSQLVAKYWGLA